jgi:hypothetical protein
VKTLYIIGNGFDLFHELPTSYASFNAYANEIGSDFEEHFRFSINDEALWQDFETDLATFDSDNFFDLYNEIDIQRENFKYSEIYGLEDQLEQESTGVAEGIQELFFEWLASIDFSVKPLLSSFIDSDYILNFNYSPLLQETYAVNPNNILHIHGSIHQGYLEFGHGYAIPEDPIFDEDGNSLTHPLSNAEGHATIALALLKKPVEDIIDTNKDFFEHVSKFTQIVVLGHSLSDVDIPYFQLIAHGAPHAYWQLSVYCDEEKAKFCEKMNIIGVEADRFSFMRIDDLAA